MQVLEKNIFIQYVSLVNLYRTFSSSHLVCSVQFNPISAHLARIPNCKRSRYFKLSPRIFDKY